MVMTSRRRVRVGLIAAGLAAGIVAVLAACAPGGPAEDPASVDPPPSAEPASAADADLHSAVAHGDAAGVREAIEAGAALESRDGAGRTPLVAATKAADAELAGVLLAAGADPNAQDDLQDSAFLFAGAEGLDDILVLTLEHGADVASTNRYGGTALIPASEHGHVSTVRILIEAGVPLDHVNNLGWTALHEAIVLGDGSADQVEVVRLLLAAGADSALRDGDGTLPRDLAAARGYRDIVREIDAFS